MIDPAGPHPGLLPDLLSKHAEPLAAHALAALADAGAAADGELLDALLEALQFACGSAHFMAELVADRWGAAWLRMGAAWGPAPDGPQHRGACGAPRGGSPRAHAHRLTQPSRMRRQTCILQSAAAAVRSCLLGF